VFALACSTVLSGCTTPPVAKPSVGHLTSEDNAPKSTTKAAIPTPVTHSVALPRPKPAAKTETYSVSVRNVPVDELLFALARDAKLNIDLHPGVTGNITINAIDQTLQQILTRIGKQVDMRWELDGPNLAVMSDTPFLRNYRVDYVNMDRNTRVTTEINSQVSSGTGTGGASGAGALTRIDSTSKNTFWDTLEKNIKDILRETDKVLPEGSSETTIESSQNAQAQNPVGAILGSLAPGANSKTQANQQQQIAGESSASQNAATNVKRVTFREAASVIANPTGGVISVRATTRQHEKVAEYIDMITSNARRQVMIEATILEVELSSGYEQGINWQSLRTLRGGTSGFSFAQGPISKTTGATTTQTNTTKSTPLDPTNGTTVENVVKNTINQDVVGAISNTGKAFLLNYVAPGLGISSTISLLETFGNVKVLSSPKISVLNNQTAVIKVVDNVVYFTVKADTTTSSSGSGQTTVTTTPNSVAVGLVMSVTPQISESNSILLNVRPTISRLKGEGKRDPNPNIPSDIPNYVPEIQTREMESMLRLTDGEVAVMGGLMSDEMSNDTAGVPGLWKLPGVGALFTQRKDATKKTELVIFLKPTVIQDPSLEGSYRSFADRLPRKDFFENNPGPVRGGGMAEDKTL
jgi:general secretion pathway protein D